jgi:hypothetical protein
MEELYAIHNKLQGRLYGALTDLEEKTLMLQSFPTTWVTNFLHSGKTSYSVDMDSICEYMRNEKNLADIEDARAQRIKKQEAKASKALRKKKDLQENNATEDSNADDEKGKYNQCRRHPKHHHTWEECYLNPSNPNNKLKNKRQKRSEQGNASTSNNNTQTNPQQAPNTEQRNLDQEECTTRVPTHNIWEAW